MPEPRGEAGVEQPKDGGRHRFLQATDTAGEPVGGEEDQVTAAENRGVDRLRDLGEEGEPGGGQTRYF